MRIVACSRRVRAGISRTIGPGPSPQGLQPRSGLPSQTGRRFGRLQGEAGSQVARAEPRRAYRARRLSDERRLLTATPLNYVAVA
jgi:hypothetical protein